ncbi:SIS domain-containing protein [Candidatus Nomurabacteria bacterium]|nr:SIS domain-containing protein [Candidatus Nomurabacteria bacterium]
MSNLKDIVSCNLDPKNFAKNYFNYLNEIMGRIDLNEIAQFVEILLDSRERGSTIFFIGNGGSAATASHFVNDLSIGTRSWNKPWRAICLNDNIAVLTAIANDYGYEDVFVNQLKVQTKKEDVLVAISASGNSPNILKAVEYANTNGVLTIGLTGFDGGKLKQIAKKVIHVPTSNGEYGPVEDIHMILDHLVHTYIKASIV